jgi:hypothetical protein
MFFYKMACTFLNWLISIYMQIKRKNKFFCPASFRETCQWLKFPLNGLRAQSRVKSSGRNATFSLWTGVFRDGNSSRNARRITAAEMKYMRRTAEYIWTDYKTNIQFARDYVKTTPILDKLLENKKN